MFIEGAPGFHDKQGPWFLEKVLDGGYFSVLLSGTPHSVIAIAVAPLQQVSESSAILNFVHSLSFTHPEPPSHTHPQGRCAAVTRRLHRVNPPNSDHVPPPLWSTALHVQKPTRTASLDFGSAGHLHHSAGLH